MIALIRAIQSDEIIEYYTDDLPGLEAPGHYLLYNSLLFVSDGFRQLDKVDITGDIKAWFYLKANVIIETLNFENGIQATINPTARSLESPVLNWVPKHWKIEGETPKYIDLVPIPEGSSDIYYFRVILTSVGPTIELHVSPGLKADTYYLGELLWRLPELKQIVSSYFGRFNSDFDIEIWPTFNFIK